MPALVQRIGIALVAGLGMVAIILVAGSRDDTPTRPDKPERRSTQTIGDVPVIGSAPQGLSGAATSTSRLRFQARRSGAQAIRCSGQSARSDAQTLATIVCENGLEDPPGIWVTRDRGRPRFLGYALVNDNGSSRVVVEIPRDARWTGIALTRETRGRSGQTTPGAVLTSAPL